MGRRTTRKPGRQKAATRPSLFFLVALAVGLVLLLWAAVKVATTKIEPPKKSALISLAA